MPDANTHPWVCVKWDPAENSVAVILEETGCSLYLVYLSDGTTTSSQQVVAKANNTWANIAATLKESVVPLCSSTYMVDSGGDNWETYDDDAFSDPGGGKQALPYALWFLSLNDGIAVPVVRPDEHGRLKGRLVLDSGEIVSGLEGNDLEKRINQILGNSVLAQALALAWLLTYRPCDTKAAIINSGLYEDLCPKVTTAAARADKDLDIFMPLLVANGALVLEGVAGIGKTHSIDKVRDYLSDPFDVVALKELLDEVIHDNTGTPEGDNLTDALKKALEAQATLTKDQKANVCRSNDVKVSILVMHPSTSYEEMIGGLRPTPSAAGSTIFTWQPGKLTRAIAAACKDFQPGGKCRKHLIVLDEINRCNLPSVLGELIYLIEPGRRANANPLEQAEGSSEEKTAFRDRHCIPLGPDGTHGDLFIPSNLFFLGTMNSSDRSILGFDQALRRRFPPYRLEPMTVQQLTKTLFGVDSDKVKRLRDAVQKHPHNADKVVEFLSALEKSGSERYDVGELKATLQKLGCDLNKTVAELVAPLDGLADLDAAINAWGCLNVFLRCVIGPDAMIGHSYWFNALERHGGNPDNAWRFGVLPQAIHAAESARMERFLADLFKAAADKAAADKAAADKAAAGAPETDKSKKETSWDRFITDYIKSQKNPKEDLEEAFEACYPTATDKSVDVPDLLLAAIGEMSPKVRLIGSGHGEKLVITDN